MEDFHFAGGMRALLWEIRDLLHLGAKDVYGKTLAERIGDGTHFVDRTYIKARADAGLAGRRAGGAVRLAGAGWGDPQAFARPPKALFEHEAGCMVFDGVEDLAARIDDDALDVKADTIMILKNAGPLSPAGMPEAGYLPIPKKLGRQGVKDMVRMSDCRMSGTAFGTVVLHIAPEAAAGGPLALAETGDRIRLSVKTRSLDLLVDAAELAARRAKWRPLPAPKRGWDRLVHEQVMQATADGAGW